MKAKCTLWPSGEVLELDTEDTLLNQLKKAGKKIKSSCGGCATCTDCMVVVKSGEMNLSAQTFEELRLLGNVFHITKERLSCQTRISGDVTIDISAHEKSSSAGPSKTSSAVSKSTTTIRKKREDIQKAARESEEKAQDKADPSWYRHWEKTGEGSDQPKRLGGNKRPRSFRFNDQDNDKDKKD